jgi:hypothetical protein
MFITTIRLIGLYICNLSKLLLVSVFIIKFKLCQRYWQDQLQITISPTKDKWFCIYFFIRFQLLKQQNVKIRSALGY